MSGAFNLTIEAKRLQQRWKDKGLDYEEQSAVLNRLRRLIEKDRKP